MTTWIGGGSSPVIAVDAEGFSSKHRIIFDKQLVILFVLDNLTTQYVFALVEERNC